MLTEKDYLADPAAGIDKDGHKVAFRYVPDAACPLCGSALQYVLWTDKQGRTYRHERTMRSQQRRAPDAIQVDRVVEKSKYERRVVGKEWLHVYPYECPNCGLLTEGHARRRPIARPLPKPPGYYVDPPAASFVQLSLGSAS